MSPMRFFTTEELAGVQLPAKFNNPFNYEPHVLCRYATRVIMNDIATRPDWEAEFKQGKMLGVLVFQEKRASSRKRIGYIVAYSGQIQISSPENYFVPPVYDLSLPHDFYLREDQVISELNRQIRILQQDDKYLALKQSYSSKQNEVEHIIRNYKDDMIAAKNKRDRQREKTDFHPEENYALQRESQFMKAELKRMKKHFHDELSRMKEEIDAYDLRIESLKHSRKQQSFALQQKIFAHFQFLNARGESKALLDIFECVHSQFPPAGAGECAAPRLLQYAYLHDMHPLAMAEFWYGSSNKEQNRKHGCYYPACLEKCAPILSFMLEGLDVEGQVPPPAKIKNPSAKIEILYEDAWLIVANKPAGMLSVPGKTGEASVIEHLQSRHPLSEKLFSVHRLDMDTSGILLLAKDKQTYRSLQQQFIKREIKKTYVAKLEGNLHSRKGIISLPICPDVSRRPLQSVDWKYGITAISLYEILKQSSEETWIKFMPLTGRTHQLRVHAADRQGLDRPMIGDPLYNPSAAGNDFRQRLMLHATSISFRHPVLQTVIDISCPFEE